MKKVAKISAIVAALFFIGCGGGSDSSTNSTASSDSTTTSGTTTSGATTDTEKTDTTGKTDTVDKTDTTDKTNTTDTTDKDKTSSETSADKTTSTLKNSSYVKGLYNISTDDDKAYLNIADDGLLTTYLYSSNCYAKNPSTINATLNGKNLTLSESDKSFKSGSYSWYYGDTTKIQRVFYGSSISAGTMLNISNTRIATSSQLETSVKLSDIQSNLCK